MNFILLLFINVLRVYKFAILARVLISWFQPIPSGRIAIFLYQSTEPVLRVFRRLIPPIGMIDLSPLIAFFAFDLLQAWLMSGASGLIG